MAQPAQRPRPRSDARAADEPPIDPYAIDRAYHRYRARRYAKVEQRRATKRAKLRFWAFLGLLLLAVLVVAVTVWSEIAKLFGI